MDRTVDVVFSSGAILETIYCILYIILSVSQLCFAKLPLEKETTVQALLSVYNIYFYKIVISMPVTQSDRSPI